MTELNGQFWNPAYGGEGFYLTEQYGRLIGAFFTYGDGGEPTWYVFDCNRTGDTFIGKIFAPAGGAMAWPLNPENVVQAEVGTIEFVLGQGWTFSATISGHTIGYALQKLFPVDEPEPNPVTVEHRLGNEWSELDVPVTGTIQGIKSTQIANKKLVREYRVTADNPLSLTSSVFNYDPAFDLNPSVEINGDIVKLFLGSSSALFPGRTKHAGFKVEDENYGTLIEVTAQVAGQ